MTQQFEPFQKVLVRDYDNQKWRASFFSHKYSDNDDDIPYVCAGGNWWQCIPYEGNENLLGTTDSPTPPEPEPELKFGDKVEVRDAERERWYRAVFIETQGTGYVAIAYTWSKELRCWRFCRKANW